MRISDWSSDLCSSDLRVIVARAQGRGRTQGGEGGMSLTLPELEEARRALDAPLYADLAGDAEVSFEFFPPKSEKMEATLRLEERREGKECFRSGRSWG